MVIKLVRLRRMAATYFTKQSLPTLLQLVRDIRIRDWVRGMRVETWLGRNPSTRFLRQDLDSALHVNISDFTGRELTHRRFSCDDPLSVGHFDSGRIARLLRLLAAPATRASVLDAPAKLDTIMWYLYCTALPQVALKLA